MQQVVQERPEQDEQRSAVRRTAIAAGIAFAAVVITMWVWWPGGVALGLAIGVSATVVVGRAMHRAAEDEPHDGDLAMFDDDLWQDFRRLRVRLGDDHALFSAAAMLVTRAQRASVAGLQRELGIGTARAQHLVSLLEREGFVGPARGSRPRDVLVDRSAMEDLQRLLHA